jgi:hypothetical protein
MIVTFTHFSAIKAGSPSVAFTVSGDYAPWQLLTRANGTTLSLKSGRGKPVAAWGWC